MMQISYQPAFDPYHSAYRLLRLMDAVLHRRALHKDHVRILDFYLLFPFRIAGIRMQASHRKYRRLAEKYAEKKPYSQLPEDRILFNRMSTIQTTALDTLAQGGVINIEAYRKGFVDFDKAPLPEPITQRLKNDNEAEADLIEFLQILAIDYPLLGCDGLKDRSQLLEYRYDAI